MTNPDWVPTMRRAAALVTDGGGITCHAAIVSRELGVPCVVGARTGTTTLHDGELVTVDGGPGRRVRGRPRAGDRRGACASPTAPAPTVAAALEPLATRLYVNLAIADQAEEVAALPVDGVGLLRAEFMITDALGGEHPRELLARGGRDEFVDRMADVAAAHHPAPSRRGRSSTAPSTSAPTSSAASRAASSSSRSRTTR